MAQTNYSEEQIAHILAFILQYLALHIAMVTSACYFMHKMQSAMAATR